MTAPLRITPATSVVHLDFNGGEDVDVELAVLDRRNVPVLLTDAVATIAMPDGPPLHVWSVPAGNLELIPDEDDPSHFTGVRLRTTRAQTAAWFEAWGDAEWQLDVRDLFGRWKRPAEGQVRVRLSRREGP